MRRALWLIGLTIVVVLVIGIWRFGSTLDERIADLIETKGSEMTGTPVTVSKVEVQLRAGHAEIKELNVGNPEGFPPGQAMTWDMADIVIDLGSLTEEPYVLSKIQVVSPTIQAVVRKDGKLNLDQIRGEIRRHAGESEESAEDASKKATRFRVDDFRITGGKILLDASALGVEAREVDLPEVHLQNLGGEKGATGPEIGAQILTSTLEAAGRALATQEIQNLLSERLPAKVEEQAKEAVGDILKQP